MTPPPKHEKTKVEYLGLWTIFLSYLIDTLYFDPPPLDYFNLAVHLSGELGKPETDDLFYATMERERSSFENKTTLRSPLPT